MADNHPHPPLLKFYQTFSYQNVYLSFYLLLEQHVMYINDSNNCYVNTMAQMIFNCRWINDLAASITDMDNHMTEAGLCYTCSLAKEYLNRTPTPTHPVLCTWSTKAFVEGLDNTQKFGKFGDLSDLIKFFFIAIQRDTKKYHNWLLPKLDMVIQISTKKSHEIPGFTYIDHDEVMLTFEERFANYMDRINYRHPRVIMVALPTTKTTWEKPTQLILNGEVWQLRTTGIHKRGNHWICGVVSDVFVILDCLPTDVSEKITYYCSLDEDEDEVHSIYFYEYSKPPMPDRATIELWASRLIGDVNYDSTCVAEIIEEGLTESGAFTVKLAEATRCYVSSGNK